MWQNVQRNHFIIKVEKDAVIHGVRPGSNLTIKCTTTSLIKGRIMNPDFDKYFENAEIEMEERKAK